MRLHEHHFHTKPGMNAREGCISWIFEYDHTHMLPNVLQVSMHLHVASCEMIYGALISCVLLDDHAGLLLMTHGHDGLLHSSQLQTLNYSHSSKIAL